MVQLVYRNLPVVDIFNNKVKEEASKNGFQRIRENYFLPKILSVKRIKSLFGTAFIISFLSILLSGCSVVEGIFKAGIWVGILVVGVIIAIILLIIRAIFSK